MNKREKRLLKIISNFPEGLYFGIDQDGQVVKFSGDTFRVSFSNSHWSRAIDNSEGAFLDGLAVYVGRFKGDGWSKKVYKVSDSKLIIYKKNDLGAFYI